MTKYIILILLIVSNRLSAQSLLPRVQCDLTSSNINAILTISNAIVTYISTNSPLPGRTVALKVFLDPLGYTRIHFTYEFSSTINVSNLLNFIQIKQSTNFHGRILYYQQPLEFTLSDWTGADTDSRANRIEFIWP